MLMNDGTSGAWTLLHIIMASCLHLYFTYKMIWRSISVQLFCNACNMLLKSNV